MTIFQKDINQTTREYKITTVVVSLITYLVALISIIAVNWDHIERKMPLWWMVAREIARKPLLWWRTQGTKEGLVDNSASRPKVPPLGATKSPASKPEDKGKKPEASDEKVDVESGTNAGESSKSKPLWRVW
jgi:hypothetical protein